jgi:hypothetical protein
MDSTDYQSDSEEFRKMQSASEPRGEHVGKVSVQKFPSRLYLSNGEAWTPDIEKAKMFDTGWAALEETTHLKLQSFMLVTNRKPKE